MNSGHFQRPSHNHPIAQTRRASGALACAAMTLCLIAGCGSSAQTDGAEATNAQAHGQPSADTQSIDTVQLAPEGVALANIRVIGLQPRDVPRMLAASGEVKVNEYRAAAVTARVAAEVVRRHANLGDRVRAGQALVTLSSAQIATAQAEAQLRDEEWQRVRELGEEAVGTRRYQEARIGAEQARAQLLALGVMPTTAREERALRQFTLTAPSAGTVLRDQFVLGEHVEPGRELFYIADESALWIEAHLPPGDAQRIATGAAAEVKIDGGWRPARVVQKHHALDATTRTIAVRLELAAHDDVLHTGEFVECRIQAGVATAALAVPEEALVQDGEHWAVFIERGTHRYQRVPVRRVEDLGALTRIADLPDAARVVVQGSFFLNAELQKGSFAGEE